MMALNRLTWLHTQTTSGQVGVALLTFPSSNCCGRTNCWEKLCTATVGLRGAPAVPAVASSCNVEAPASTAGGASCVHTQSLSCHMPLEGASE